MNYVTTRDIVIPAGTVVSRPPSASTRWGRDYEAVVGHGADHCSRWVIDLSDAIALGLVEPEKEAP